MSQWTSWLPPPLHQEPWLPSRGLGADLLEGFLAAQRGIPGHRKGGASQRSHIKCSQHPSSAPRPDTPAPVCLFLIHPDVSPDTLLLLQPWRVVLHRGGRRPWRGCEGPWGWAPAEPGPALCPSSPLRVCAALPSSQPQALLLSGSWSEATCAPAGWWCSQASPQRWGDVAGKLEFPGT